MNKPLLPFLFGLVRERGTRGHLARGTAGSLALAGLRRILQLAVSVLLARLLAPEGYGRYAFALSLVGIVGIFVAFGLPGLLTREVAAGEARGEWGLVRGLLRRSDQLVLLALAIVLPAGFAGLILWPGLSANFRATLAGALAFLAFSIFAQLRSSYLMGMRRVLLGQTGTLTLQPILLLAAVAVAVYAVRVPFHADTAMALTAASALFVLVLNELLVRRYRPAAARTARPEFRTRQWLRSAVPFALMTGLFLFNSQTDIVMLGFLTRAHDVGLYRVAASGAGVLPFVLAAVNPVIGPTLARLFALGERASLRRAVRVAAAVSFAGSLPVLVLYLVWGRLLIRWIYGAEYVAAWLPLVILSVGQLANTAMGPVGLVLNMTGHERDTVWVLAVAAALNVALNGALIPFFGMEGAAVATATSLVFWNLTLAVRVRARLGFAPVGLR